MAGNSISVATAQSRRPRRRPADGGDIFGSQSAALAR
jgi:hypothetical protein